MRRFIIVLVASFLVYPFFADGQNKVLDIADLMNRQYYPTGLNNLQWQSSGTYTWVENNNIIQGNIYNESTTTLGNLGDINEALEEIDQPKLKVLPSFKWQTEKIITFLANSKLYCYDFGTTELKVINSIPADGDLTGLETNSFKIAYTIENNLYVAIDGKSVAVTKDTDKGIVNGQSVHRNEFGIKKGSFWSPKGNKLAFYRMDETMVTEYPLVDINTRIATVKNIRYPMAGMKSHHVTVGVFDPAQNKTIFLKTGEPAEQYLTNVSWSPDEKYIYIAVINRDQNHLWLNKYDAITGNFVKTLFEETDAQYVEPQEGLHFLNNTSDKFLWESRRDGWNHLYLYSSEGQLLKQITKGNWEITDFLGLSSDNKTLYYLSTQQSPIERHLYQTDMQTMEQKQLTQVRGTHTIDMSPDTHYALDRFSGLEVPSRSSLISTKTGKVRTIYESANPLKGIKMPETSIMTLKAEDGSDLYCRMIKPVDFDENKKYPVLVYVYGGPHSQLVSNTWLGGANLFFNYLASQGYIIWTLDNRGTSFRGADFEQAIHRRLGDIEEKDQMVGVNYLKSLPYVDATRIGIDGWSFGGFMTLTLKLRNPDVFKVATCGGPVIDWKYYEIMYGERYMDTPEQNPEGYKKSCLLNYVKNLKGKVLVIHGAQDGTVVWQHTLSFLQQCIAEGKQVDYFVYPQHEHNVMGKDRLHLYQKLADYYKENL